MKKILFILFLIPFLVKAQDHPERYQVFKNWGQQHERIWINKSFIPPRGDTSAFFPYIGSLMMNLGDSNFYKGNGSKWIAVGGITIDNNNYLSGVSFSNGILTFNRNGLSSLTQSIDGRYNKISDTAAMLSHYLRIETDPVWSGVSANYRTKTQNDLLYYPLSTNPANYLTTFTETDPLYTANGTPKIRTITINGNTKDLSANRSWTVAPTLQQVTDSGRITSRIITANSFLATSGENGLRLNQDENGSLHANGYSGVLAMDITTGELYLQSSVSSGIAGNFPAYGVVPFTVKPLGGIKFGSYGGGSHTGTPAKGIAFTSTGDIIETALSLFGTDTTSLSNRINLKLNKSDTSSMLSHYLRSSDASLLYYPLSSNPAGYLTSFTETDPIWLSDSSLFLKKTDATLQGVIDNSSVLNKDNIIDINGNDFQITDTSNISLLLDNTDKSISITTPIGRSVRVSDQGNGFIRLYYNNSNQIKLDNQGTTLLGNLTIPIIPNSSTTDSLVTWNDVTGVIGIRDAANFLIDTSSLSNRINLKQNQLNGTGFVKVTGTTISYDNSTYATTAQNALKVNISDTSSMLANYLTGINTNTGNIATNTSNILLKLNKSDTAAMLSPYLRSITATGTYATITNLALKVNISDTGAMLTPYLRKIDTTAMLSPYLRSNIASGTYATITNLALKNNISDTASMLTPYVRRDGSRALTANWDIGAFSETYTKTGATAATVYDAFIAQNTTVSSTGNQMYGGYFHSIGQGWKSTATAASQSVDFRWGTVPVQGTAAPTGNLTFQSSINGGAFGNAVLFTTGGSLITNTSTAGVAGLAVGGDANNGMRGSGGFIVIVAGAADVMQFQAGGINMGGTQKYGFTAGGTGGAGAFDSHMQRLAANKIGFGNGTNNDFSATIAAGSLGLGNNAPVATALLEMTSTAKGFLPPRMTKTQRDAISSPATGLEIFQTDNTPGLRTYNGTNWMRYTETID